MAIDIQRDPTVNDTVTLKIPIHKQLNDSGEVCGLEEFHDEEAVQIEDGGTGAASIEGVLVNFDLITKTELVNKVFRNIVRTGEDYTAKDYEQVLVDTTQNNVTIKLPANPEDNETVIVQDATYNASNHPITVDGNGKNVNSGTEFVIDVDSARIIFIYHNNDWKAGI